MHNNQLTNSQNLWHGKTYEGTEGKCWVGKAGMNIVVLTFACEKECVENQENDGKTKVSAIAELRRWNALQITNDKEP